METKFKVSYVLKSGVSSYLDVPAESDCDACDLVRDLFRNTLECISECVKLNNFPVNYRRRDMLTRVISGMLGMFLFCFCVSAASAQTVIKQDAKGNFSEVSLRAVHAAANAGTKTGQTFTNKSGKVFEVYKGARGGLFYWDIAKKGANAGAKVKRYIIK